MRAAIDSQYKTESCDLSSKHLAAEVVILSSILYKNKNFNHLIICCCQILTNTDHVIQTEKTEMPHFMCKCCTALYSVIYVLIMSVQTDNYICLKCTVNKDTALFLKPADTLK